MADDPKQLKVEEHVRSDADFMAAIDEQMEALARRRRGRKPFIKATDSTTEIPSETVDEATPTAAPAPSGESIAVRNDQVSDPLPTATVDADKTSHAELHLRHAPSTVQPLNPIVVESPEEVKAEPPTVVSPRPRPIDVAEPKVMDVRVTPKPTSPVKPAEETVIEAAPKPVAPDLSHPEEEEAKSTAAPESEPHPAMPVLNTEKLASQVRRDPDLETISADVAEKEQTQPLITKYHLPLHQSRIKRHHPPVNTMVAVGLFLLLGLFIAVIAVDMELIDVGIDLPFDFF